MNDKFNYVKGFDLFGVKARQIPCLTAKGEPNNELALKIGLLYINEDNGDMYKCVKGNGEEGLVWIKIDNKDTNTNSGQNVVLTGYAKETWVQEGFQPKGNYLTSAPVTDVNGKTGSAQLGAADVGADPTGTAAAAVSAHNTSTDAHTDLRLEIQAIREQLAAFLDVDEETLNELSELIARILANQTSIEQLTTGKVSVSDIIDNLITNMSNKPLSAAQGVAIKALIDNLSASLANYQPKGNYANLDDIPKVPNWAMQASKPAYTASEVGADPKGTAASAMSNHNTSTDAHTDLRQEIKAIREQLMAFLDVDEETLNELSELIARIVANQTSIEQLTTGKVNVADIINNLTTNAANKPLSAAQGVVIKALIDRLTSGKLDASKLQEAINTALAQAKANGEFDGAPGYTPRREIDYWTLADQEAIVQQVITTLGTPVFGRVESGNKIIMTGNVVPGVYEYWFEDEEGKQLLIGTIEHGGAHPDSGTITLVWTDDVKIDKTTGVETADGSYARTGHVEVWEGYEYTISQVKINNSLYSGITICFYDANGDYLGYNELWGATSDEKTATFTIMENAATIKVRLATTATSELIPTSISLSYKKIASLATYTNQIPLSINADGTPYVGSNGEDGYKSGYRIKSDGTEVEQDGNYITGYIPCDQNAVFQLRDVDITDSGDHKVAFYDKDFVFLKAASGQGLYSSKDSSQIVNDGLVFDGTGMLSVLPIYALRYWKFDDIFTNIAYVRFSAGSITDSSIITVNEEIIDGSSPDGGLITENIPIAWEVGLKLGKNDNNHTTVSVVEGTASDGYAASQHIEYDPEASYTIAMSATGYRRISVCCYNETDDNIGYLENIIGESGTDTGPASVEFTPVSGTKTFRLRFWFGYNGFNISNWTSVVSLTKAYTG